MDQVSSHDCSQKRFLWGTVLAAVSFFPFIILFSNAFRGISQQKATGLAAVAGGLSEAYITFGLILTFVLPVASIVLVARSFSGGNQMRKLFSLLIIVCGSFMLLLYGLFAWFFFVQIPH